MRRFETGVAYNKAGQWEAIWVVFGVFLEFWVWGFPLAFL